MLMMLGRRHKQPVAGHRRQQLHEPGPALRQALRGGCDVLCCAGTMDA